MFNFLNYVLAAPIAFAKKIVKSPIGLLFYGLVSQWYLVTMSLMVVVLYWVITGLYKAGIVDLAFSTFADAGKQIKGFAQNCTPKIKDINAFLKCLMDTPEYTGDAVTSAFENDIQKDIQHFKSNPIDSNSVYLLSPYDKLYDQQNKSVDNNGKASDETQASSQSQQIQNHDPVPPGE